MLPGQPSRTLLVPAVRRAAHQLLDTPLIFNDPIAVGLVPEASEYAIRNALEDHRRSEAMLVRSLFALRSRFAEDRLAAAAARGVRQYVILGAGLDTFPWRQPDFARGLRIFAADHVATLAWTQVRFWERGQSCARPRMDTRSSLPLRRMTSSISISSATSPRLRGSCASRS